MHLNINLPDVYSMHDTEPVRWQRIMVASWSLPPGDAEAFILANEIADSFWVLDAMGYSAVVRDAAFDIADSTNADGHRYDAVDAAFVHCNRGNVSAWAKTIADGAVTRAYSKTLNQQFKNPAASGKLGNGQIATDLATAASKAQVLLNKQILITVLKDAK